MPIPDRRVLVVLVTLVGAMTLASSLLLALEPAPMSRRPAVQLRSVDQSAQRGDDLFETNPPVRAERFSAIVIHDSGTLAGSAETIGGGLGYHFVIGNGQDAPDGKIAAGPRWSRQLAGAFIDESADAAPANRRPIGICLIGDTNRQAPTKLQIQNLRWLVRQLQRRCQIPGDQVVTPAGRLFPHSRFGRQLLTSALR